MKKQSWVLIFIILLILPSVNAGVGIVYYTTNIEVNEGQEVCIKYGAYNPFLENARAVIYPIGEIAELTDKAYEIDIPANTLHSDAKEIKFCFKVPYIYERDCLIGNFFCNKECTEEPTRYEGEIIVQETARGTSGTGSSATSSASAQLNIIVSCTPQKRNYFALSGLVLSIIALMSAIGYVIYTHLPSAKDRKKQQYQKQLQKLQKLKQELRKK